MLNWWETFFDADYIKLWSQFGPDARAQSEADGLWQLLGLENGSRVLDAPCGYGRLSQRLASRGAQVLGVDCSETQLALAEKNRGELPKEGQDRLQYLRQDVRFPLAENDFDAAINIFTSIGYGSEEDDLATFRMMRTAVHPGGVVFVETLHRDTIVAFRSHGSPPGKRLPDGTLLVEEGEFDPIRGILTQRWFWSGPQGQGKKEGAIRIYTATELIKLLEAAGLEFISAHNGCSPEPFTEASRRLGVAARRS